MGAGRAWSAEELTFLINFYPTENVDWMANQLGRKSNAIFLKANRLGLTREVHGTSDDNPWIKDEILYLKHEFARGNIKKIAKALNRSTYSIYKKADRLGLKREVRTNPSKNPWTENELTYLKKHYPTMNTVKLGIQMNRSPDSIATYASNLGIRKNKKLTSKQCQKVIKPRIPWTQWEEDFLRETFNTLDYYQMRRNGLNRSISAIHHRIRELGLNDFNRLKRVRSKGGIIFHYTTEEDLQEKWDYVNFWRGAVGHVRNKHSRMRKRATCIRICD